MQSICWLSNNILIEKLNYYGICGFSKKWFQLFLAKRQQFATLNNSQSSRLKVICGVPQQSTLSALLFKIYISDLHKAFVNLNITHFAYDTILCFHARNIGTIESFVNFESKHLVDWLRANNFSVNGSKSNFLNFVSITVWINTSNITIKAKPFSLQVCKYLFLRN